MENGMTQDNMYQPPSLVQFGSIEAITGTKCIGIGDKGLGLPSDTSFKFGNLELPLPICNRGGGGDGEFYSGV